MLQRQLVSALWHAHMHPASDHIGPYGERVRRYHTLQAPTAPQSHHDTHCTAAPNTEPCPALHATALCTMQHSATLGFNMQNSTHKPPPLPTTAANQTRPTCPLATASPHNPLPLVLLWLLGRWRHLPLPLLLPLLLPCPRNVASQHRP
jgi:hypothetical protein